MRCPDCNKFVSQEAAEPEVQDLEIDEDGKVTAEVRLAVTCAECGTDLKETTFSLEADSEEAKKHKGEGHELSVDEDSIEPTDEYQTKDRRGKQIKNPRYQTHLYGVTLEVSVTCTCTEEQVDSLTLSDNIPASSMDEV